MAIKPKAILSTHDGREASPITKASNVLFENGQTAQDILNDRQDAMISPVIENSSSMFKVGQGDDVDYSANVVNGAYESMVLKGKSMVNCIQEPSSQDVVLPYEFTDGQYVTINDTKESGTLGVELKGQTLVNLARVRSKQVGNAVGEVNIPIKPNTKYIAFSDVTYEDTSNLAMFLVSPIYVESISGLNGDSLYTATVSNKGGTEVGWNQTGAKYVTFTSASNQCYLHIRTGGSTSNLKYNNMQVFEYQEGMENWDIPYFKGMTSCKMPILKSVESLFDAQKIIPNNTFTYSHSTNIGRFEFTNRVDVATFTNIQLPAGTYDISFLVRGACDNGRVAITFAKDGQAWHGCSRVEIYYGQFGSTTFKEVKSQCTFDAPVTVTIVGHAWSGNATGSGWCEFKDIRFTPVGKTSILSLPEEVVLRSLPNGVCDTLNTRTGVYIQNCIELIYDGETNSGASISTSVAGTTENTNSFSLHLPSLGLDTAGGICDCLKIVGLDDDEKGIVFGRGGVGNVFIKTDKTIATIAQLKEWLKNNNIRVVVRTTPIITKINLSSTLKSWNTTTHIYSEIPENTLYPTLSHSNPSYPVILKPSTKYSIVANSYSNNHTNSAINFNLGGATASTTVGNRVTTITTPSTLSNELLTMGGRGNKLNNVMVIEGDVVGDEPYFEGICDCKSPILSNTGKNLFNPQRIIYPTNATNLSIEGNCVYITDGSLNGWREIQMTASLPIGTYYVDILENGNFINGRNRIWVRGVGATMLANVDNRSIFTISEPATRIDLVIQNANNLTFNNTQYSIHIEKASTAPHILSPHEPYKSNILSANGDKIELTEDMFEQGTINETHAPKDYNAIKTQSSGVYFNKRVRLKSPLPIKPNTSYIINVSNNYDVFVGFCLDGVFLDNYIGYKGNAVFTTPSDCNEIALVVKNGNDKDLLIANFSIDNIRLSEVDKTIVLRSLPNGVCDTLNVETGEYVQRIGHIPLSSTLQYWEQHDNSNDEYFVGIVWRTIPDSKSGTAVICNKLKSNQTTREDSCIYFSAKYPLITFHKDSLDTFDMQGFNAKIDSMNLEIQYELEVPIVKTVDLSGFPFSYENGHVQLSSGSIEQSLTPKVEYSVATNRNGQIRSNQKMVERHQKQLDQLQAIILANLVNSQYNQTLTTLKYELSRV